MSVYEPMSMARAADGTPFYAADLSWGPPIDEMALSRWALANVPCVPPEQIHELWPVCGSERGES